MTELIEYQCRGCQYLVRAEPRDDWARYRECRDCFRVPDLQRELVDERLESLMWAYHALAAASTASDGAAERVAGGPSAPRPARAPPPEATPCGSTRKPARSEGTPVPSQRDAVWTDGGDRE